MEFKIDSSKKEIELIIHSSENFVQFTDEFNIIFNLVKKHSVMDYNIKFNVDIPKIKITDKALLVENDNFTREIVFEIEDLATTHKNKKISEQEKFDKINKNINNIKYNI